MLRHLLRIVLVVLALAGFFISFYLTLTHYRNALPPCYVTTGCESVLTSRYSTIVGIPLSLIGAIFFAVMFYLGIALIAGPRRVAMRAYEPLAFVGILVAVLLFALQAMVLKAYCVYCLATEVIAMLIWAGSLWATSSGGSGAKNDADSLPR